MFVYYDKIVQHYISQWNTEPKTYMWDKGPYEKLSSDFRILEFEPHGERNMWTYATNCMSQPNDENPIEIHIFSSIKDDSIIEILTALAYYHRKTCSVGLNHTVNFGRPWQDESACRFGYISLPILDGPELENLEIPDINRIIKFYWIIPITQEEVNYKIRHGFEMLEEQFDKGLNFLDPKRKSLV